HLEDVLTGIPRKGMVIVHRADGRPYSGDGFASIFQREKKRLGLGALQFHGLRHTAGQRLAEAGCSDREIMAILGHRTAAMVTRYTRGAEQKRLAKAAIVKLEPRTRV
ncbi:MAG: tyrosine-type recombinase/integrase, partial [Rhodospirillaceae bacterium]|nr:tyrosine-type recombinase/integrase [Rhodospirillaceae bacterium]